MSIELLREVEAAAKAKRDLERTLEAKLREEMKQKLHDAEVAVEIAAAKAFQDGSSKSDIGRAIGSKDYNTYNGYIQRGLAVAPVQVNPTRTGAKIEYDGANTVIVNGVTFEVMEIDTNGTLWFTTEEPIWNANFSEKNETVVELDGATDGELYEEVLSYVKPRWRS